IPTFDYDSYGTPEIVVRATKFLGYAPGGLDYVPTAVDIGAADEIHGESGDDFIYGMKGDDVLFGDGQNDAVIGGYGNDWISAGSGDDGVIGDDGRIFTSRNSSTYGEPLYGIAPIPAAQLNLFISTAGKVQQATINVDGVLKYTVDLTPYNVQALSGNQAQNPLFHPNYADDI